MFSSGTCSTVSSGTSYHRVQASQVLSPHDTLPDIHAAQTDLPRTSDLPGTCSLLGTSLHALPWPTDTMTPSKFGIQTDSDVFGIHPPGPSTPMTLTISISTPTSCSVLYTHSHPHPSPSRLRGFLSPPPRSHTLYDLLGPPLEKGC
jgi:hypothetical protein